MENTLSNNNLTLQGKVVTDLSFSHEVFNEKFYYFTLKVSRLSDKFDEINITISEKLLEAFNFTLGQDIILRGQIRSYNKFEENKNKLILTAFARSINLSEEKVGDPNQVILEGYICKKPVFRTTPFGREITDLLIAVNRAYNKSDYIPIITWGRNAKCAKNFNVGDKIKVIGRFQSREYTKMINGEDAKTMVAYEVSVSQLLKVDGEDREASIINNNFTKNLEKSSIKKELISNNI